jgi:hypothetical protein
MLRRVTQPPFIAGPLAFSTTMFLGTIYTQLDSYINMKIGEGPNANGKALIIGNLPSRRFKNVQYGKTTSSLIPGKFHRSAF